MGQCLIIVCLLFRCFVCNVATVMSIRDRKRGRSDSVERRSQQGCRVVEASHSAKGTATLWRTSSCVVNPSHIRWNIQKEETRTIAGASSARGACLRRID